MAVKRKYRLNLRNYGNLPAIMLSQYDEGYALEFEIRDGTDAASDLSAYTVTLKGTRADTLAYSFSGTIATNVLTFVIDTTMTACAGRGTAEIAIKDTANDVLFATFNMPVFVERAAVPEGSIDADVERAQEIAEQVQEIVDNAAAAVSGAAEKWATGQIDGTDVPSTDPAYENNAKYYAEQAADSAASIGIDATLTQAGKAADAKKTGDEITALKEGLSDLETLVTGMVAIQMQDGFIDIKSAGSVTDMTPIEKSGCRYAIVPCKEGDLFIVNALVESGKKCAGFLSANGTGLSINGYRGTMDSPFVAPANSAYFVFNSINADYVSYKYVPDKTKPIPMHHIRIDANGASRFVNCNTTNIDLNNYIEGQTYVRTAVVPCKEGDKFVINARGGNYARPWMFINASWSRISVADGSIAYTDYELTAPANSAYLIINDYDFQESHFGTLADVVATHGETGALADLNTADKSNLVSAINEVDGIANEALNSLSNPVITDWTSGGYISTGESVSNPVDITTVHTNAAYRYKIIECVEGDVFILNTIGGGYPRAYAFLDSNNYILSRSNDGAGLDGFIATAPANTAKLVLNDKGGKDSYYGEPSIGYKVDALEDMGLVPAKLNGKIMVNFGDSIWGMGQGAVGISGQLAKKTGATVHNCGMNNTKMSDTGNKPYFDVFCLANLVDAIVSGDYTTQDYQIQNDPSNIPMQAPNAIADLKALDFSTVNYVTISLGTNDWAVNQPLDNTQNPKDKNCIGSALRYSIEKILTAFPQALIVIISTIYRAKKVSGAWVDEGANTAGYTLQDINAKYAEIANEYHLKFIDDFNIGLNKYTTAVYTSDGLHPNTNGWEFIAENISSRL